MNKKIWASAHKPLPEQGSDFEYLPAELQARLNQTSSDMDELVKLAHEVTRHAISKDADIYQLGGSPAFQAIASRIMANMGITLVYAHSVRQSVDTVNADGSVSKTSVFVHSGWIVVKPSS